MTDPRHQIDFLLEANSLEGVPREGFRMNGIEPPEDVAAHTAGVAVAALLIADRVAEEVDRGKLLTMAVLHDIGEARVGDTPLVAKTEEHEQAERRAAREILASLPSRYAEVLGEYEERRTIEARIVKAADKLQMMTKVLAYEQEGRGDLAAFWRNTRNFEDAGLPEARELFEELRRRRGDGLPIPSPTR